MRKSIVLVAMGVSICCAQAVPSPNPKKIYIEEFVIRNSGAFVNCSSGNCTGVGAVGNRNISLETTREILKHCPTILTVTDNRAVADYDLRISPGSSTLFKQNGDVAFVSPAKHRPANLAKDVCGFVSDQH